VAEPQGISLPIVYASVDDAPILFANQFVIQIEQDEFILTIGQLQPPILLGSPEQREATARGLSHVSVRTLIRVGMTPTRLEELVGILNQQLALYHEQKGGGKGVSH
jgi:hypothetical protein